MEPGALLREARRRSRLSQHEVAARAGCSQSAVARVESDERDPSLAMLERLLAACDCQLFAELEPLDRRLDQQIEAMAVAVGPTSLSLLSLKLLYLEPRLTEAEVPFVVDGPSAAILYGYPLPHEIVQLRIKHEPGALRRFATTLDIRRDPAPDRDLNAAEVNALPRPSHVYDLLDPDAHWFAGPVRLQVRVQAVDPCVGSVPVSVRYSKELTTVQVVPLHRLILPRRYARALERVRQRLTDVDIPRTQHPDDP